MKLLQVLKRCSVRKIVGNCEIEIKGIAFNADEVKKDYMFICLNGSKVDGANFVGEAIKNGANCIVCERMIYSDVTTVIAENNRELLSIASQNFYGNPANDFKLVTIVGTNGKTTTAYLLHEILKKCNIPSALIGTMYYEIGNEKYSADMTTPDPIRLNELFSIAKKSGVKVVVMELSAHAIYLEKLFGLKSEICVFTNFSQDHLDYFKTLESYKSAKTSYFCNKNVKLGIINSDDEVGRELLKNADIPMLSYGIDNPSDTFAMEINYADITKFLANVMNQICEIESNLFGKFNVSNVIAAIACAKCLGIEIINIVDAVKQIYPPQGRCNIYRKDGISYVIDFAHTPDGLYNLLKEGKRLAQNRIITVFGCGGDRDISKRPIMGNTVSAMSDITIITSDNPRTENPKDIADDILEGISDELKNSGNIYVELDRSNAIGKAVSLAKKGDLVLIAGKGSENYIDIRGNKIPYSDERELTKIIGGGQIDIH